MKVFGSSYAATAILASALLAMTAAPVRSEDVNKHVACSAGDNHILTFDGLKYDCHGEGEFILAKSNTTEREVQARYEHVAANKAASAATGFVIQDEGDVPLVQVSIPFLESSTGMEMYDGCKLQLFVDGLERDFGDGSGDERIAITQESNSTWVKYAETGMEVNIRYFECRVSICVYLPDDDTTVGLLGTANSNITDDWTDLSGNVTEIPESLADRLRKPAYDFCTENFCVTEKFDSLFTYPEEDEGLDFDYYQKCGLPFGSTIEHYLMDAPQNVIDACQGDLQCLIDVQTTGTVQSADFLKMVFASSAFTCNLPGGECDESNCCFGQCVDFGGFSGKRCSVDSPNNACAPEFGSCDSRSCCDGFTCKDMGSITSVCVADNECNDEHMSCSVDDDCCGDNVCLDDQRGGKACRVLPFCAADWNDCSRVGCCGGLECVDNVLGGRQCKGVPDCWDKENGDCSVAPCCGGLTCIQDGSRSLCKDLPEVAGLEESCQYVPCNEDEPLECVDVIDLYGRQVKECRYAPGEVELFAFNDLNSNGLQDEGEPGIPGVKFRVFRPSNGTIVFEDEEERATNVLGKSVVKGLPRGTLLQIKVTGPPEGAIRTLNKQSKDDEIDSDLLDDGLTEPFEIGSEMMWARTSLGYRMPVDTTITVFNDLNSNGLQDDGELGIKGVAMHLIDGSMERLSRQRSSGTAHEELITGDDGVVTFTKIPQGLKFRAKVSQPPPGGIMTAPRVGGDSALDSDLRSDGTSYEFVIKSSSDGTHNSLDLGYRMPETVIVRVWNDANSNGIQDDGEAGIEGVKLRLVQDSNKVALSNSHNDGTAHSELATDIDGLVRFTKVPQGQKITIKVTQKPQGAAPTFLKRGDSAGRDSNLRTNGYSEAFELTESGAPFSEVDLGYRLASTMVVRVWDDANGNGIQDQDESGINGVELRLIADATKVGVSGLVTTSSDGYATFDDTPRDIPVRVEVLNAPQGATVTRRQAGNDSSIDSDLGPDGLSVPFHFTDTEPLIGLGYQLPTDMKVRVWDDANNNGVQDEGELGVEGVRLRLVKAEDMSTYMNGCTGTADQITDRQCSFCSVADNTTQEVSCGTIATMMQEGDHEGKCGEQMCKVCNTLFFQTMEVGCSAVSFHLSIGNYEGNCQADIFSQEGSRKLSGEDDLEIQCRSELVTDANGVISFPGVAKGVDFKVMVVNEPDGATRVVQNRGEEGVNSDLGEDGLTEAFNLGSFVGSTFDEIGIGYSMPDNVEVRVWDDINGNGVQDDNELGIQGVDLYLIKATGGERIEEEEVGGGNAHRVLTTDEEGKALFMNVPVGDHLRVKVANTPPGALRTHLNRGDNEEADSDLRIDGTTTSFNLRSFDGNTLGKVDIGFRMPKDVEVRVWDDANSNGIQDAGELGVQGVKLRIIHDESGEPLDNVGGGSTAHEVLTTNEDGLVEFKRVPKGRNLHVKVLNAPVGSEVTLHNRGESDENDSDMTNGFKSNPFNLNSFNGAGVYGKIDLGFRMPKTVVVRVWNDRNENGIQDENEEGIRNVEVRLLESSTLKDLVEQAEGTAASRVKTDSLGRATFTKVPLNMRFRAEVTRPPEHAIIATRNAGTDEELDSDLNPSGISDSFKPPNDISTIYTKIDLGYVLLDCDCSPLDDPSISV